MHFFIWVVLFVSGALGTGGVLWASLQRRRMVNPTETDMVIHYALALSAWVPMWLATHFIPYWFRSWLDPHHTIGLGYPWWFWILLAVGLLLMFVPYTFRLGLVFAVGIALAVVTFLFADYFAPKGGIHMFNTMFHVLLTLAVIFGVVAVGFAIVWLFMRSLKGLLAVAGILALIALLFLGLAAIDHPQSGNTHEAGPKAVPTTAGPDKTTLAPSVTPTTGTSATPVACTTWNMTTSTPSDMSWVYKGVVSIQNAKTKAQAAAAIQDWLSKIKVNPSMLAAADEIFLHEKVSPNTLITSNGCASSAAATLADKVSLGIALADVKSDQAPANGYNTGTSKGAVFANNHPGITGNRKAVKVVMKDGTTVWVMARCGNPVTKTPPPVPPKTPAVCVTPSAQGPSEKFNPKTCTWVKPPQSWECKQNAGKNCPTNPAHQPVQSNNPSLTRQPTTVPSTAPKRNPTTPVDTKHPKPAPSDGNNGGSTSNPIVTGTPTPVDSGSHTSPISCPFGC